jgi:hypothetical protein
MRFTLPDDIFESIAHNEAEQEHYFGVPKNVVENDHIPLPPGLSRIRTIRKIHMELDVVKDRLQKWDLVQEKLVSALGVLRETVVHLDSPGQLPSVENQVQQDFCYLKNRVSSLQESSDQLDPRSENQNVMMDGYIEMPRYALHYLAVYDDNPWEH